MLEDVFWYGEGTERRRQHSPGGSRRAGSRVWASIGLADGHTIRSDFPEIQIRTEAEVGGKTVVAQGNLHGGGPLLRIETTTGDIRIVRSP